VQSENFEQLHMPVSTPFSLKILLTNNNTWYSPHYQAFVQVKGSLRAHKSSIPHTSEDKLINRSMKL
jgi:hypothetical protein